MSEKQYEKAVEMTEDLLTFLEKIGEEWITSDVYHVLLALQERMGEVQS